LKTLLKPKEKGAARCLPVALVKALAEACPKIIAQWERVLSQLKQASRSRLKIEPLQRLHHTKKGGSMDGRTRAATGVTRSDRNFTDGLGVKP
jgi:hypothetical protein